MDDLISRQAAIDKINERQRKLIYCFGIENDLVKIMDIAEYIITTIPSAQPEQKKGKWIDDTYCSECGWVNQVESGFIGSVKGFNFCPNCGADMRGDKDAAD